ncbi:MAG: hypothetical protein V4507_01650 [Verrucomicrobiota bacterium]
MKIQTILVFLGLGLLGLSAQESTSETNAVQQVEAPASPAPAMETTTPVVTTPEVVVSEKKIEVAPVAPVVSSKTVTTEVIRETVTTEVLVPKFGLQSVPIPAGTPYFLGARYYDKKAGGWGWVKKPDENWKQARWVAIKETPHKFHTPHRSLPNAEADHEFQYKLLGYFADYQVYDPIRDELLDVFVIQGYESLGLQKSIERKPGPPSRFTSKKSGAYTRRNSVQADDDNF